MRDVEEDSSENWELGRKRALLLCFPHEQDPSNQIAADGNLYFIEDFQQEGMVAFGYYHSATPKGRTGSRPRPPVATDITNERRASSRCLFNEPPVTCSCQKKTLPAWSSWPGGGNGEINRWLQAHKASSSRPTINRTRRGQGSLGRDRRRRVGKLQNVGDSAGQNWFPQQINYKEDGPPGWLSSLAPAFGPGRDPGDPGSSPTSGSLHGACFYFCLGLCPSLSLSLCVS